MENKGYSRTQTTKNGQLRVFLRGEETLVEIYSRLLIELGVSVVFEHPSDYILSLNQESFSCESNTFYQSLPLNPENLKSLFTFLNEMYELSRDSLFVKKEKEFLNRWQKLALAESQGQAFFSLINELMKLFFLHLKIEDLPVVILGLKQLRAYKSCQILLHEKGNIMAESFDEKSKRKQIDIKFFQKIYNQVRKSKNKQFSQISSPKEEIEVAGTFLAREFELKAYSMLLIVSRNDFLPPADEELESFSFVCAFLNYFISESLRRERADKRIENIKTLIQLWEEKIEIIEDGKVILSNNKKEDEYFLTPLNEHFLLKMGKTPEGKVSPDIQHHQRIALLGDLLNTLQHELSNPLFGVKLSAEILADEKENGEMKETLIDISHHSERCQSIIKNFSSLYHEEKTFLKSDLVKLVHEAIVLTKSEIKEVRKKVVSEEKEIWVMTNPTWCTQIFFNALLNAGQAIKNTSKNLREEEITISLSLSNNQVEVKISDSGPGISEENNKLLFSPFFTTKKEGTGLGLSICQNLAQKLSAKVTLENNPNGKGALFTFIHPLDKEVEK